MPILGVGMLVAGGLSLFLLPPIWGLIAIGFGGVMLYAYSGE